MRGRGWRGLERKIRWDGVEIRSGNGMDGPEPHHQATHRDILPIGTVDEYRHRE